MPEEIEFRDPPSSPRGVPGTWAERLSPLLEHVGRWAVVRTTPTSNTASKTAWLLRKGQFVPPPGRWEFRSSGCEVFARYLGPDEDVTPIKAVG